MVHACNKHSKGYERSICEIHYNSCYIPNCDQIEGGDYEMLISNQDYSMNKFRSIADETI